MLLIPGLTITDSVGSQHLEDVMLHSLDVQMHKRMVSEKLCRKQNHVQLAGFLDPPNVGAANDTSIPRCRQLSSSRAKISSSETSGELLGGHNISTWNLGFVWKMVSSQSNPKGN